MISFKLSTLKNFIAPYAFIAPTQKQIEDFRLCIQTLLQEAVKHHKEKSQEQEIGSFLAHSFSYHIRSRDNIDLAVLADDKVNVIIEVKAQNNQKEFITSKDFPLAKALCEAIFYFLKERDKGNNFIKHIIVCTYCEYYLFDAQHFLQFKEDKEIKKLFKSYKDKSATDPKTQAFYESLQEYLKSLNFEGELPYTHFCLSDNLSTEELSLIYQLLSPQVLLKARKTLDANTLNKGFYEELLYILGLQEVSESGKSGGKILIKPSGTPNSLSDAIAKAYGNLDEETIFTLITTWNNRILFLALLESMLLGFKHINKPFLDYSIIKDFGTLQSLFFEVLAKRAESRSPSLIPEFASIPYLNSSLFDRIALEREGKSIGGLYPSSLQLFSRSILRKDPRFKDRESLPPLEYLFEFLHAYDFTTTPKDISQGVKQNHDKLINSAVLGLVFEKLNGYKEGSFYTPSFITSYMCKQSITQATLERFNSTFGWKCESLQKLKEKIEKEEKISDEEFLNTLLSLKICDPSVGSGHFLVSALNEIVLIAHTLRIISLPRGTSLELENDEILIRDREGLFSYCKPTKQDEDEHIIQTKMFNLKKSIIENCLFGVDINPNSCEITKLRLWIELLKYSYYIFDENGKNTNALETLPNIDINIKCGNSLISYFDLKQSLTQYPNIKTRIEKYKRIVHDYKEGFFDDKTKIDSEINELVKAFQNFCFQDKFGKTLQILKKQCDKYRELYSDYLAKDDKELSSHVLMHPFPKYDSLTIEENKELFKQAHEDFAELKKTYKSLYNLSSNKPFEWRFAFPEVLDEEGNFLGFDCVIGNPPYISAPSQEENPQLSNQRKILSLSKRFESLYQKWDLYIPFIELGISQLCKENAICSMIVPYPLTNQTYGKKLREILTSRFNLYELTDLRGKKIFESATVTNCIVFIKKQLPCNTLTISGIDDNLTITQDFQKPYTELIQDSKTQVWNTTQEQRNSSRHDDLNILGDFCYISKGMVLHSNERRAKGEFTKDDLISDTQDEIHCKPYIEAKDFKKYGIERLRFLEYGTERCPKNVDRPTFEEIYYTPRIISNSTGTFYATYCDTELFYNHSAITSILWKDISNIENRSIKDSLRRYSSYTRTEMERMSKEVNLKYILGILNSKYTPTLLRAIKGDSNSNYPENIRNLPIPKITQSNQSIADKIIALVEKILALKESDPKSDTQELEQEIDSLVYTLYSLTEEEIKIIEEGR
ncbi:Eco57I restriction-modification methylase domain-containing protein [uncultured Helicobacter sp.]|uniref:type IIG restriction enzyme/methyltransferase n=1 Tax=uncultured Helicobacter sp. TaxID=175537 RepID=UPI002612F909|nr:Eco57I restriction-modification methylase domain-containing protein [uncultured Helicobacter sp.]